MTMMTTGNSRPCSSSLSSPIDHLQSPQYIRPFTLYHDPGTLSLSSLHISQKKCLPIQPCSPAQSLIYHGYIAQQDHSVSQSFFAPPPHPMLFWLPCSPTLFYCLVCVVVYFCVFCLSAPFGIHSIVRSYQGRTRKWR